MYRGGRGPCLVAAAVAVAAFAVQPASAAPPPLTVPQFGAFRAVLAQGEGQSITGTDLAQYEGSGNPPSTFVNQQPLYVGIMPQASSLTPASLDTFYRNSGFGSMPGGIGSVTSPPGRPGAQIFRDARYGMAHIYAGNRPDLMFAAGYATAQERLFLMDAVRRTAEGTLAALTGASAAHGDADQLT